MKEPWVRNFLFSAFIQSVNASALKILSHRCNSFVDQEISKNRKFNG